MRYYCVRYLGWLIAVDLDRDTAIRKALDQLRPAISPISLSGLTSEEKALKALQIYEETWTPSEAWYALVGEETPDEFLDWIMRAYDETYYSVEEAIEDYVYRLDDIEDAIRDIAVELLLQYVREHGCERWKTAEYPIDDEDPHEDERILCDRCGQVIHEGWPEE